MGVHLHALSIHLYLLRPWPLPGCSTSVDSLCIRADHQGCLLRRRGTHLVLLLFDLDVRGRLRTCAVRDLVYLHLLLLRQSFVCPSSSYRGPYPQARTREVGQGCASNRAAVRCKCYGGL